jgi:tight adherence protein B
LNIRTQESGRDERKAIHFTEAHVALLIAITTFLVATGLFVALWMLLGAPTQQDVLRSRIQAVRKAERRSEVAVELQLLRDEMISSVPLLNRLMVNLAWTAKIQTMISQAGLKTKAGKILLICGVVGLTTFLIVDQFIHIWPVSLPIGLLATMVPLAVISYIRKRRMRQFEERFPEALDLLGRAVRAGHAFTTGLEIVSKESPEPLASEFRACFEEQNYGLPMRDALLNLTERMPLVDVRFFVTALLVQKETGGNLAEILDELARVIRDRFRIYREVNVKTAQGRLTALILIGLPIFTLVALEGVNPAYVQVLFRDPVGPIILGIAALLQVIGSIFIWRIVHIEV